MNFDADQQATEGIYPGQNNNNNNNGIASEDQIMKTVGDNHAPVSKLDQHQSTTWTSYVYTIMKLIVLLLLLLLLALFCLGLILMCRKRFRREQNQIDGAHRIGTPTSTGKDSVGVKKRFTRNRFQDTATKGSIFSFNKPVVLGSRVSSKKPDLSDLTTSNPTVASSTTSMLPEGSGTINRGASILSSSATSTLTRPVPAKRITKSPNSQTLRLPDYNQQQQQRFQQHLHPTRQTNLSPSAKQQLGNKLDRFVEMSPAVSRPSEQSLNVSYYHQSSISRSFATPSPGGSILVPRETMRTVYMQTDKRPSYESGLPSSQI